MATKYRIVLVTVPSRKEGLKITQGLVHKKLAACVNFVPGIESFYWWKGKVHRSSEILLLIKTHQNLVNNIITFVRDNHSYEVCEVVSLPIMEGNKAYLNWIGSSTNLSSPMKDLTEADLEREVA